MKTKPAFFRFFLLVVMMLAATSLKAADFYWRVNSTDNVFNNLANWTNSPTGIGGNDFGRVPDSNDNVFFVANPSGGTASSYSIVAGGNNEVRFRSITVAASVTKKIIINASNYYIAGNIQAYNNLEFNGTRAYLINGSTNPLAETTIDMGTSDKTKIVGGDFYIQKAGNIVKLINHDLNTDANFFIQSGSFDSNGFNATFGSISVSNSQSTPNTVKFDKKLTLTSLNANNLQLNQNWSEFNIYNINYDMLNCDVEMNNSMLKIKSDATNPPNSGLFLKSLKVTHPNGIVIRAEYGSNYFTGPAVNTNLTVTDFHVNTPFVTFTLNNGTGYARQLFKLLAVTNSLNINRKTTITLDNIGSPSMANFRINNIAVSPTGCGEQSILQAKTPLTFTATGSAINSSNLQYIGIIFEGSGVKAPKTDDGGGNTGAITWNDVSSINYYWIGGNGNWNDPSHWSSSSGGQANAGGCAPTGNDNVYVDENSFSAPGQKINLTATAACKNIYWTDTQREGQLTVADASFSLAINGDADFSGVQANGLFPSLYFYGTGNQTLKSSSSETDAIFMSPNIVFQTTGNYTLTSPLISARFLNAAQINGTISSSHLLHYKGGFSSGGYTISVGKFLSASQPSSATRRLNLVNSQIYTYYNGVNNWTANYAVQLERNGLADADYDFTGSHFHIDGPPTGAGALTTNLYLQGDVWKLWDFTFENKVGTAFILPTSSITPQINFNNLTFNSDFTQQNSPNITVETLTLAPNKTFSFAGARTLQINKAVYPRTGECGTLNFQSTSSAQANIKAMLAPFVINGAFVKNINATGAKLEVTGGSDLGNNTNVSITPGTPKDFYWVGGTGNWNDPTHWSIGLSGGDPTVTNAGGCLPGIVDNVFFDGKSFSANGQTVTINVTPINIHNMTWTPEAGAKAPVFRNDRAFNGTYQFNMLGSLVLASGMVFDMNDQGTALQGYEKSSLSFNFTGTGTAANSQTIQTNGVVTPYTSFTGGTGRYDLLGPINGAQITFTNGSFYTNGNNIISSGTAKIWQTGANVVNLLGSDITSWQVYFAVNNCNNWQSSSTNLNNFGSYNATIDIKNIPTSQNCTVAFNNITSTNGISSLSTVGMTAPFPNNPNKLSFNNITLTGTNETQVGSIITNTITYAATGSVHQINPGDMLQVNESVFSSGTPCNYISLQSSDVTANGKKAIIYSPEGTLILPFFRVTNIQGDTRRTADAYEVMGINLGGSANMTFNEPPEGVSLYDPITVKYIDTPYKYVVNTYGSITKMEWRKDGVLIPNENTNTLNISEKGTHRYVLRIYYAGANCTRDYARDITVVMPNYWMGSDDPTTGTQWDLASNWTDQRIPSDDEDVEFATKENFKGVSAKNDLHVPTTQDKRIGNLINNSDKDLVVVTGSMLTISKYVTDNNPSAGTIVVKSAKNEPTGTLTFTFTGTNQPPIIGTVEFYNKAYQCNSCGFYPRQWQYFGMPIQGGTIFPFTGNETVRKWSEPTNGDKWLTVNTNDSDPNHFAGYEITNKGNSQPELIYQFKGGLVNKNWIIKLSKTSGVNYSGMNLIGNPFTAAIPISTLGKNAEDGIEKTVYLFNTGTRDEWRKTNGSYTSGLASGQYLAVPTNVAGETVNGIALPDRIPAMHAFMMRVMPTSADKTIDNGYEITVRASSLIRNQKVNDMTWRSADRDDARNTAATDIPGIVMDIIGTQSADRVWLFENPATTRGFDNGWDGHKMPETDIAQIYVSGTNNDKYQVATVPQIEGTEFGFVADADENYTVNLSVTPEVESRRLYLRDLRSKQFIPVRNGVEVVVQGFKGDTGNRFRVVSEAAVAEKLSSIEVFAANRVITVVNHSDENCTAYVYDAAGRLSAQTKVNAQATSYLNMALQGVYVVKVVGNTLNETKRIVN